MRPATVSDRSLGRRPAAPWSTLYIARPLPYDSALNRCSFGPLVIHDDIANSGASHFRRVLVDLTNRFRNLVHATPLGQKMILSELTALLAKLIVGGSHFLLFPAGDPFRRKQAAESAARLLMQS